MIEEEQQRKRGEEERRKKEWEEKRHSYIEKFAGRSSLELSGAPAGSFIARDGLPAEKGSEKWGDRYTFFVSTTGRKYHSKGCKKLNNVYVIPINAYTISTEKVTGGLPRYTPCMLCNPSLPDVSWVKKYNNIKYIRKTFNIPEPQEQ